MAYEDRYKEFDEYLVHGEPGQREKAVAFPAQSDSRRAE